MYIAVCDDQIEELEKLPKPTQTPPPAEYPVKPGDEPKPKY